MTNFYAVTLTTEAEPTEQVSRFFQTLRAARRWQKWLREKSYVRSSRILRGGAGGEEVK